MGTIREDLVQRIADLEEDIDDLVEDEAFWERELAGLQFDYEDFLDDGDDEAAAGVGIEIDNAENTLDWIRSEIATLDEELILAQDELEEHDVDGDVEE